MASKRRNIDSALQESNDVFGRAWKSWREINKLSQQDGHNWSKDFGAQFWNSQCAYLEKGDLDPKCSFWISIGQFNSEIAKNKNKKTGFKYVTTGSREQVGLKSTRERLCLAKPFLTYNNKVATTVDFFAMYIGFQEINPIYLKPLESPKEPLTEEFCNQYGRSLEKAFNEIARELMLSKKEAWEGLKDTENFPQSEEYLHVCQDLLRGEHDLTKEETVAIAGEHKRCPCKDALTELVGHPIDYLEEASEELFAKL